MTRNQDGAVPLSLPSPILRKRASLILLQYFESHLIQKVVDDFHGMEVYCLHISPQLIPVMRNLQNAVSK